MNLVKMIADLREQKRALEQSMLILERIARGQSKRRGRPPAFLSNLMGKSESAGTTRKPFSAETRKKMAASQRRRWAALRKKAS
jgi:hypothetical protein